MADDAGPTNDPQRSAAGQVAEIPCLWFFLPLPHPVGLPAGWTGAVPMEPIDAMKMGTIASGLACSLFVHQVSPRTNHLLERYSELMATGVAAVSGGDRSEVLASIEQYWAFAGDAFEAQMTIVEVSTPIGNLEVSDDLIDALVDQAIAFIRELQGDIAAITYEPMRLISRANLPPFVPLFRGRLIAGAERPSFDSQASFPIQGSMPPTATGQRPEELVELQLTQLSDLLETPSIFAAYVDLRREALVQRLHDGNARLAVVSLAAGAEVLLDTLLVLMLWEERVAPEVAAPLFDRSISHTSRVVNNFPNRLGGRWSTGTSDAVGVYFGDLVRLRHRVVHAGHEPSNEETDNAWIALRGLERFIGDRLAADGVLTRFTRTAISWMGRPGLEKRGGWTRRVRELTEDKSEPTWVFAFRRYQVHVDRLLDSSPPAHGSDVGRLQLYALRLPTGTPTRWVLRDGLTLHAAEVADPSLLVADHQISSANSMLDEGPFDDLMLGDRICVVYDEGGLPGLAPLTWVPEQAFFPELRIYPGQIERPDDFTT